MRNTEVLVWKWTVYYTSFILTVRLLIDRTFPSFVNSSGCKRLCCSYLLIHIACLYIYNRTNGSHWSEQHASTLCNHGIKCWCSYVTENGHSLKLSWIFCGYWYSFGLRVIYWKYLKASKWLAWYWTLLMMPLESINPGDAFKLGILGSVEKR